MSEGTEYKKNWQDPEFYKFLVGFKQFILSSEEACIEQCVKIFAPNLANNNLNILDVGAGDGAVSLAHLKALSTRKTLTSYTAFDLSKELVAILKSREAMFKKYVPEVYLTYGDATDFTSTRPYHLIVAFCSWFGIPFQQIPRYLSLLEPGGVLAITLSAKDSITIDLPNHFVEPICSADDLCNWLKLANIDYTRHEIVSQSLNRDDFLHSTTLNPESELFFHYLLRGQTQLMSEVAPYLAQKPDRYFKTPKDLILMRQTC